jgi:flagellar motor protein MotB
VVDLWFGDLNPVGDNATESGRRLNRRVEIAIGGVN